MPEIAFSVERSARRKGVGSILFKRLITEAEGRGYESLRITTGYSNEAMGARPQVRRATDVSPGQIDRKHRS